MSWQEHCRAQSINLSKSGNASNLFDYESNKFYNADILCVKNVKIS